MTAVPPVIMGRPTLAAPRGGRGKTRERIACPPTVATVIPLELGLHPRHDEARSGAPRKVTSGMITITELAQQKIKDALKDKGPNPTIRVYVAGVG